MWNRNEREERGAGGPVLRDPISRQQGQPPYNIRDRGYSNSNNRNYNGNNNPSQNNSRSLPQEPLFPPTLDDAPFPIASPFSQPPPPPMRPDTAPNFLSQQINPFMSTNVPPPFFTQNWQPDPNPYSNQTTPDAVIPTNIQQPSPVSSSTLSSRLLSLASSTNQSKSPAQPSFGASAQRSTPNPLMSMSLPPPPPAPPFSAGFNSQLQSNPPPSHQTPSPKPFTWGSVPSGTSSSHNDSPASPFNNSWNQNFDNRNSPFTQQQQHRNQGSSSEPQRPSSFLPNSSFSGRNGSNNGQVRRNNFVPQNKPSLLPTPKLVPYPPPPPPKSLNSKSSNMQSSGILRNPRGMAQTPQFCNFVRENSSPSNNKTCGNESGSKALIDSDTFRRTSVVPYTVGDAEDDDEDEDFLLESGKTGEAAEEPHDFFSDKMVKHFASILKDKPIDGQMQELMSHILLPAEYLGSRVNIVRNLHEMLTKSFHKCHIYPYGADFIGIGNSDDSVNIFVDLTGNQGPSNNIESTHIEPSELTDEHVNKLYELIKLDENHKFFGQIVRRTNYSHRRTNLPVISFIHSETQVRCNLRLDNYLLVQEAKVIQFICSLDSRICPLLALVRYWSSVHKVLDTPAEDTKNRFVTFLVLFFLAKKNIIPNMAYIQSLAVKHEYFENIDISFCDVYELISRNNNDALDDKTVFCYSTLSLLMQFFALFAETKLEEQVVSLWKAEFIPKENFSKNIETSGLPPDLRKRYMFGVNGKIRDKRLDCGSRLSIQDFQDLTENLSLDVADYDVNKFQYECQIAADKIETLLACASGNLMDLFVLSDYTT
ncbi:unnamed protein product [Orchesella dallaii]|uniref:Poly(A) RNA polymerase mitochondrial-like central palm domain-containing protein n=1 Tax=Orchesella dallaii TaxID=48710 RepID=A0ABP1QWV8_9HEXA